MSENALIDLQLSGVVWELSDLPISAPRDNTQSKPVESNPATTISAVSEIGRFAAGFKIR